MEKMMHSVAASKADLPPASITVGIDVSKDYLDAARHPGGETLRVANTHKGQTALLRWIGDLNCGGAGRVRTDRPLSSNPGKTSGVHQHPSDQGQPAAGTALC